MCKENPENDSRVHHGQWNTSLTLTLTDAEAPEFLLWGLQTAGHCWVVPNERTWTGQTGTVHPLTAVRKKHHNRKDKIKIPSLTVLKSELLKQTISKPGYINSVISHHCRAWFSNSICQAQPKIFNIGINVRKPGANYTFKRESSFGAIETV